MTASGGDKASSPHFFFVQSCPAGGGKPPGIFFAADAAPRPGGMAPAPYAAAPGPLGPPAVSGASALRPGPPPWRWPARPRRWRAGPTNVCGRSGAGRAGTGPARPPPPQSQRPGLVRPRPVGPRRRWCWLVAGGGAPGPWSACVRSRCWPPGCGGPQPPRRGALPWGGGPVAGCGRLGVGLAAWPAPVPRLRLTRPPPAGAPQRPGGGVGAAPCLGPARGSLWAGPGRRSGGQRPPGPAPCPTPGRGGTMPPGRRGFGAPPAGCGPPPPP